MMKFKLFSLLMGILFLAASCDDENFGFNVSSEVGLDLPATYTTDEVLNAPNFNPPPVQEEVSLGEVDAFADELNELNDIGSLRLNSMNFSISGVEAAEMAAVDEISVVVDLAGTEIVLFTLDGTLTNVDRADIPLTDQQRSAIENEFFNSSGNDIRTFVNFDFAEVPQQQINMDVTVNFDVTLRIRGGN